MGAIAWVVAGFLLGGAELVVGVLSLLMIGVAALGTA
ncbi:NfeD family protein, partial [Nocardia farcinica]|nr:NfeD family protein [Nocardia farcinica]